jgi:hypothetical protein
MRKQVIVIQSGNHSQQFGVGTIEKTYSGHRGLIERVFDVRQKKKNGNSQHRRIKLIFSTN